MKISYFKKVNIIFVLLFVTNTFYSQEYNPNNDPQFATYAAFVSETWNITCQMPEKFQDMQFMELKLLLGNKERGNDMFYCPVIQSDNEDCILFYPVSSVLSMSMEPYVDREADDWNKSWPRNQIIGELKTVLGLIDEDGFPLKDTLFVFDDYVTTLTGKGAKDLFNVDKVYFYDMPLHPAYREKYVYCTGIVLSKKDCPDMFLKYCFTENGKKEKEKYIRMLKGKIWYEDCNKPTCTEKYIQQDRALFITPDSLRSPEEKELMSKLEVLLYEYTEFEGNKVVRMPGKEDFIKTGVPEKYYYMFKQDIEDINNYADTTTISRPICMEESFQESKQAYFEKKKQDN